jgi:SAM-dependent methyltransferase
MIFVNKKTATANTKKQSLSRDYFDYYDGDRSYEECFDDYFGAEYTAELIEIVWGAKSPYRLLDAGSANGMTLAALKEVDIEAWGVENNKYIHSKTLPEWQDKNLLASVRDMPFEDNFFDFIYETCLCYVPREEIEPAIRELNRVTRRGLIFGSLTSDVSPYTLQNNDDLFDGTETLNTTQEWSKLILKNGFQLAVADERVLESVWECEVEANEGEPWYASPESMRYCFYTKE